MDVKNNPAGRLHDILANARRENGKAPARAAWAAVFGIKSDDTGALLRMLADLIHLVEETKLAISRLEEVDHELHLRPLKKIEVILSKTSFDAPWDNWKNQIDEVTLYGLQFSADRLSRASGWSHISEIELSEIRSAIEDLYYRTADSSLPVDLKNLLLRNLDSIRQALTSYVVRGIDGIQEEIERSLGAVMLHRTEIKGASPQDQAVWESFFSVIEKLNKLVNLAKNGKELVAPAIQALGQIIG